MIAFNTNEKVYLEDDTGCLARMCKVSFEIFGTNHCSFYHIIENRKPSLYDWKLFKSKVQEYYNFDLDDELFNSTNMVNKNE